MNMLDYVLSGGMVSTEAGWDVKLNLIEITEDADFALFGEITAPNGTKLNYRWDKDGLVENASGNHGLSLVPFRYGSPPKIYLDKNKLKDYNNLEDFIKGEY
jgi:hypothetical protein